MVVLFEPKTSMNYLAINLCIGNKILDDKLKIITKINEEKSAEDSVLPMNARRNEVKIKY